MKSTIELWRTVNGYEGLYQVSNLGRVRSVDHLQKGKFNSNRFKKGKILKTRINDRGYLYVTLCKNNCKSYRVHRLVGMTFPDLVDWTEDAKGKPFDEITVNHKDQNKLNNCVDNLEWCNMIYQVNYGTRNKQVSQKLLNRKDQSKPVLQYTLDMVLVAEYPSMAEAERKTGINKATINLCCKGKLKSAGGYIWKYKD